MGICLIENELCTDIATCGVKLNRTIDNDQMMNNQSSAIDFCHQLKFQWIPNVNDVDRGILRVINQLNMDYEVNHVLLLLSISLSIVESIW